MTTLDVHGYSNTVFTIPAEVRTSSPPKLTENEVGMEARAGRYNLQFYVLKLYVGGLLSIQMLTKNVPGLRFLRTNGW